MSPRRSAEQDRNAGEVEGLLCVLPMAGVHEPVAKNVDGRGCQSAKGHSARGSQCSLQTAGLSNFEKLGTGVGTVITKPCD